MQKKHRSQEILGKAELAEAVGRSTRTLDRWAAAGMPRRADGRYDLREVRQWLTKTGRVSPARKRAQAAYLAARARRVRAQAQLRELEVGRMTGQLIEVSTVERELGAEVRQIRDGFLRVFDRADIALATMPTASHVRVQLRDLAREFLKDFAQELTESVK